MSRIRPLKELTTLFLLILFLTNAFFVVNPASADGNFADSTRSEKLGRDGYSISWDSNSASNLDDSEASVELVIGVAEGAGSWAGLSRIIGRSDGRIVNFVTIGAKQAVVVDVPIKSASTLTAEAHASGTATYVEPNKQSQVSMAPNDQYWSQQWGPQKIQADYAWNTTTGNQTILVAVVDTGIDYNHPDLAANYVPLGYNWVAGNNNPLDDHGHGTHCAGIIAATFNNAIGVAGMAQVRVMAEKALNVNGSGWDDDLANAIVHATDRGAKIISNSWGSNESSTLIHDAIVYARNHGVLVLAAAGNSGENEPEYPGAQEEVVCVSATNRTDTPASFTTYGSWVDVAAPGVSIYSTMPTYPVTMNDRGYTLNYAFANGTSMATPMAAGVAALIWSRFPTMNADLVRYQLETTCDDLGIVGLDDYYGHGRVNAKTAVELVLADDLLISDWNPPNQFLKVNNTANFEATILNRALSTQTNTQIKLFTNGSIVNSTTITTLPPGISTQILLSWTPTATGYYNVTCYVVATAGENITQNNAVSKNFIVGTPPSASNWTLVATDPDEGTGLNLKSVSTQMQSGVVYFKVAFYYPWVNASTDIDTAIMVDSDRNIRTGLPDHYYTDQNIDIGADYLIVVGDEGPQVWRWNTTINFFDVANPINLSYLDAPDGSSEFIVGVNLVDLETDGVFDFAVADVYSDWDWMPNTGYRPFIPQKTPQELAVTLLHAVGIEVGTTLVLNATVFNFGTVSESNVNLRVLINGTVVKSVNATQLASGASYSTVYLWTPNREAIYNVTVYAQPAANENSLMNNAKSVLVPVSSKIALISDGYQLDDVAPILDAMWINYDSHYYNYYYLYTEDLAFLNRYQAVIFFNADRNISAAEQSALNSYLAAGGNLLVTGYDSLGDPNDARLANVVRSLTVGDDYPEPDLYVVNSTHPIMNGPYEKFPVGFHISGLFPDNDFAEADTARNAVTVAELADGKDKIIATESLPGKVVYWNGDGRADWMDNASCTAMLKNLLLWFVDVSPPQTTADYDGQWHTADFTINLSADDYFGVNQTYYKLNGGSTRTVSANGQPLITTESANNTLEYWSVDIMGNQETHHMLTQIKLDKTGPSGSIQINSGANYTTSIQVTLTLTASDATSGVNGVRYSNDGVWDAETWDSPNLSAPWTLLSGDGTKTVHCQIRDAAGLTSTVSASIILDTVPPNGSILINNNATYTNNATVNLTLNLTDTNSNAATMRFSNDNATWSNWQAFNSSTFWNLTNIDGARMVYVQFKDNAGLTSTYNASIILDTTSPTANAGSSQTTTAGNTVTFNGGGSTDANGIVRYVWNFGDGSSATGVSASHVYVSPGTYTASLTVQDPVGNTATASVVITVQPQPTPTPTQTPTPTPTPSTQPTATPTPSPNVIVATKDDGSTLNLVVNGNITASQISNARLQVDQTSSTTTISFALTGESGNTGFGNVTIPKAYVPSSAPIVHIDDIIIDAQGYSEDADNFYVWYTTHFSTRQVSITFTGVPSSPDYLLIAVLAIVVLVVCVASAVVLLRRRQQKS